MNRRRYWVLATLLVLLTVSLAAKKQKQTHAPDDPKRALHALDRLTFGPRPGDVQAVAAMGVDKWIDLQLHPEQINDTAMQSRLAGYRTLQMSTREMVLAFPPNPIVKAVMDGKMAMPRDPNRRAIYAAAIAREQEKQQQKQNTATDANASHRHCAGSRNASCAWWRGREARRSYAKPDGSPRSAQRGRRSHPDGSRTAHESHSRHAGCGAARSPEGRAVVQAAGAAGRAHAGAARNRHCV